MITILNNIMASNGFVVVDIDNADNADNGDNADNTLSFTLFKSQSSLREEYFLTLELADTSDLALREFIDAKAQDLFEDIQKSGKVEIYFEKNCTMLICLNSSELNPELVLALEEDPYNFKKNVITYSNGELAALNGYLTGNAMQSFSNDAVNKILNAKGGRDFLDFKYQKSDRSRFYDLAIRILLKLPFLVYSPHEQKLENLQGQIDDAIPGDKLEIYQQILAVEWTDENILEGVESIWGAKA